MWKAIQTWWKTIFHFSIELSILEILFGIPNENKDNAINIYNYVILHAKYYIYISKKQEKDINMYNLLLLIKKELRLKRISSIEKLQLHKFNRNWAELDDNL
jgi:tRNA U34 5-carboxymethylaminomethyl modifying enzyme MnmG/GidA